MSSQSTLTQIEDDIYQLRLPLPFALNHVNVYLLHSSNGWTIVDCGINWDKGRQAWQQAFSELGITGANIEKIVLTHVHPDHFGLAGWLYQQAQQAGREIKLYTSAREDQQAHDVWKGERLNFEYWLRDNGMPDDMASDVDVSMESTHTMTQPHPPAFDYIHYEETVQLGSRTFRAIHAPGHSDGQLIFYDESDKLLLSGDHVLMKITPNIGLWQNTDPNPLGAYMLSLRQLSDMNVRRALPGHKHIIEDWSGRIAELLLHHQHRLDVVVNALENGAETPYSVTKKIFETSRFTPHEWRFAIAESLAHLEYLRVDGTIQQDLDKQRFAL